MSSKHTLNPLFLLAILALAGASLAYVAANTGGKSSPASSAVSSLPVARTQLAQVSGSNSAVRSLPTTYTAGIAVPVSIIITPAAGTVVFSLEEKPPANWTVSGLSSNCAYDQTSAKVKCGPYFTDQTTDASYMAMPPAGESGTQTFSGSIAFDALPLVTVGGAAGISQVGSSPSPSASPLSSPSFSPSPSASPLSSPSPSFSPSPSASPLSSPSPSFSPSPSNVSTQQVSPSLSVTPALSTVSSIRNITSSGSYVGVFTPSVSQRPILSTQNIANCPKGYVCVANQAVGQGAHLNQGATNPAAVARRFTRSLALGSTGRDVKNLQIFLNAHGFTVAYAGVGSSGHETSYFGPATYRALIRFQNANAETVLYPIGLKQGTGYFGPATMRVVNSM